MSEHKLTISGKNISIDEYVTSDFARKIIALLYSDNSAIAIAPQPKSVDPAPTSPPKFVEKNDLASEFTNFCTKNDVRRYCEIVLATGVYLASKGKESFDIKDYRTLFLEFKGSSATNAPSNIRWALGNNWIAEIENKKYKVTPVGRRVLNERFPDSVRGSTRGKPKRKRNDSSKNRQSPFS